MTKERISVKAALEGMGGFPQRRGFDSNADNQSRFKDLGVPRHKPLP